MKTLKLFLTVVVLLGALIGGLVVYVFNNINQIVKDAVETHGPKVTQTKVELRDVDIKLTQGSGELSNFVIRNPKGFKSEHFLRWDTIGLAIDPASIRGDVIVINDVVIAGINIKVEERDLKTNVQAMLKNLPKSSKKSSGESSSGSSSQDPLLALKHLSFKNNSIDVITEKFGSTSLKIPGFELHNLGDANKGLTPEELGKAILEPLLERAKSAAEKKIREMAQGKLEEEFNKKKKELEDKADAKKKELEDELDAKKKELKKDLDEKEDSLKEDAKAKQDELESSLSKKEKELEEKQEELKKDAESKLKNILNK